MNTVRCKEFVELVTQFLDGTLKPDAERLFVEHIGLCEGCERYFKQVRQTVSTLRTF
jgi:predicted anti-sigma-YlaC factor YlaD